MTEFCEFSSAFNIILLRHGPDGHLVSAFLRDNLVKALMRQSDLILRTEQCIRVAIQEICADLMLRLDIDISLSGSTCMFVLRIGSRLFCVNIGDSRAIAGRPGHKSVILQLSLDHTFEDSSERSRVIAAGGLVRSLPGENLLYHIIVAC